MSIFSISKTSTVVMYIVTAAFLLALWSCAEASALEMSTVISSTNLERTKAGMLSFIEDERLNTAASEKAEDICTRNYWAHTAPDGTTGWYFVKQAGYDYKIAGENLAKGFQTNQEIVDAWMASPRHKDNILREQFIDIGVGIFVCEKETIVVAMYGAEKVDKKILILRPNIFQQ